MPKSKARKKPQKSGSNAQTAAQAATQAQSSRRRVLALAGAGVLLLGGGAYAARWVQDVRTTHDLTRIGEGIPSIVQVHDPSCALCLELQRNTKRALRDFDDGSLQYLVATIGSEEGGAFAARHGVGHVTLVLFDGAGNRVDIVSGVQSPKDLAAVFANLAN